MEKNKVVEREPEDVDNLSDLRLQARENTRVLRDLRVQLNELENTQKALINKGEIDKAEEVEQKKKPLEKNLKKRRKRSSYLLRKKKHLTKQQEPQETEEEKSVREFRESSPVNTLSQRREDVTKRIEHLLQDVHHLTRNARTHSDVDLVRRLSALKRGCEAALECLRRVPSLSGLDG